MALLKFFAVIAFVLTGLKAAVDPRDWYENYYLWMFVGLGMFLYGAS